MKIYRIAAAIGLGVIPAGAAAQSRPASAGVAVVIETTKGRIEVAVDTARAPATARNFLRYVDGHFFDGGQFGRTVRADNQPTDSVRIAVIQAYENPARDAQQFPPIPLERTTATGLHHVDGTISMARNTPASARSSFFICVGDQPALDFGGRRNPDGQGFGAFGRVTSGMAVVRAIWSGQADGQRLTPPVRIIRVARASGGR